jgi:hypothetical protein
MNETKQNQTINLNIIHNKKIPKVSLIEPTNSGYLLFALEVDHRPPIGFFLESKKKQKILRNLKTQITNLNDNEIIDATLFKTILMPPGRGNFLKKRPEVEIAKFDVVLLVEFNSHDAAVKFKESSKWARIEQEYKSDVTKTLTVTGKNVRRIGPVDHSKKGVFLFNYFFADDVNQNLSIWEHTAGWFEYQTGLDNSELILPDNPTQNSYKIINHCRWNHLVDIMPSLLFKPSFRGFVLKNFESNNIAATPILYRLA